MKQILQKAKYSAISVKSILNGSRKPSYAKMLELNREHNVPFEVWEDIKKFIVKKDK